MQFAQILQHRYPAIYIEGGNFPPPAWRVTVAQILGILKFIVIGAVIMNQFTLFTTLNVPPARIEWIRDNKVFFCLFAFFVSNFLETQLLSTGAFEVYVNGARVWSKLESGHVPSVPELVDAIESQLRPGQFAYNKDFV